MGFLLEHARRRVWLMEYVLEEGRSASAAQGSLTAEALHCLALLAVRPIRRALG